tara:strand:- start:3199 stop:3360 length:162 start_codon:yes stop_codon:yes gene_type:complete
MHENIINVIAPKRYVPFTNNKLKIVEGLKRNNSKVFKNLKRNIILKINSNVKI